MKLRFDHVVVLVAVLGTCAGGVAQIPFVPAETSDQAATTRQRTPEAQANVAWLMTYMLAHEGYRFDDVPMMERAFGK